MKALRGSLSFEVLPLADALRFFIFVTLKEVFLFTIEQTTIQEGKKKISEKKRQAQSRKRRGVGTHSAPLLLFFLFLFFSVFFFWLVCIVVFL